MRKKVKKIFVIGFVIFFAGVSIPGSGWAKNQSSAATGSAGLQQRIDFGNAYIMGQSIKSGSVYLMNRKQSEIKSMLEFREDYRQEILEDFKVPESESDGSQTKNAD